MAIGTDTLGGVYLIGNVNGARESTDSIYIDTDTTIVPPRKGMLLVKYDTDGNFQWLRMPEDTVIMTPPDFKLGAAFGMDVAPNGDCYIYSKLAPGTYGEGAFEATYEGPINANYGENIYVLKYDRNGNCTGGIHLDFYYSGTFFHNTKYTRDHLTGRFYASGYRSSLDHIAVFGGDTMVSQNHIVQFDSLGFVNWTTSTHDFDNPYTAFLGNPSVDDLGNVYVTGFSYNNNSFGEYTFYNNIGTNGFPIFAKIDSNGNVVFATNASTNGDNTGKVTAYSNGQVGVAGDYAKTILWGDVGEDNPDNYNQGYNPFLAFFDTSGSGLPNSFNVLYSSPLSVESVSVLTSDNQGNFYIGGRFSGQLYVADETLYNQTGNSEGFIAKFGTDSCYCPLPMALFTYDTIPNENGYVFAYTGTADVDSVIWDFGDGQTDYGFNPFHDFAQSGNYTVCATAYNACGADSVCTTIEFIGPVGVKAINGFEEIRLYPNPAQASLNIDHALPGTRIDVIDAVGHHLHSVTLQSSPAQIDISSFTPGIYLLQLTDSSGKRGYARFVKQ